MLGRFVQAVHMCRDIAHMYSDGVDFSLEPGFTRIDDADSGDVPGGVLALKSGAKLGVVRIAAGRSSKYVSFT